MSILPVCVVAGLGLSKKLWIEFYEGVDLYVCLDTWKNVRTDTMASCRYSDACLLPWRWALGLSRVNNDVLSVCSIDLVVTVVGLFERNSAIAQPI